MSHLEAVSNMRLAEAYIPMQTFDGVFQPEEGLCKGTIFPSLFRPYNESKINHNDRR